MELISKESYQTRMWIGIGSGIFLGFCGITICCIRKIRSIWRRSQEGMTDLYERQGNYQTFSQNIVQNYRKGTDTMPAPTLPVQERYMVNSLEND